MTDLRQAAQAVVSAGKAGELGLGIKEFSALEAALAAQQAAQPVAKQLSREQIGDIVREHLRGLYYCGRVWEAWSVGTMSEDDFSPAEELETADEIADSLWAGMTQASWDAPPQQAAADHPAYQLGFADGAAQYAHKTRGQIREQAAEPVAPVPMPGGIRLTVVERCELIDWRDKCVDDAVSRTLAAAQPQQAAAESEVQVSVRPSEWRSLSSDAQEKLMSVARGKKIGELTKRIRRQQGVQAAQPVAPNICAGLQQAYLALEELDGPGYLIGGVMHHRISLLLPMLNEAIDSLADAAAQPQQDAECKPYGDLRNAKWLDPECYGAGACQSLKFKAAQQAAQPVAQEPIHIEAVAEVVLDDDDVPTLRWLVEGGVADLPAGMVLMISDLPLTDDYGSGEVFRASQPQQSPLKERPDFVAGYDAGLADGRRIAEREQAAQPVALTGDEKAALDRALLRSVKIVGEAAQPQQAEPVLMDPLFYPAISAQPQQARKRTEQDAWEDWAAKVGPAGDVDEVQRRWLASTERAEFMDEAAQPQQAEPVLMDPLFYPATSAQPQQDAPTLRDQHKVFADWWLAQPMSIYHEPPENVAWAAWKIASAQQAAQPQQAISAPAQIDLSNEWPTTRYFVKQVMARFGIGPNEDIASALRKLYAEAPAQPQQTSPNSSST